MKQHANSKFLMEGKLVLAALHDITVSQFLLLCRFQSDFVPGVCFRCEQLMIILISYKKKYLGKHILSGFIMLIFSPLVPAIVRFLNRGALAVFCIYKAEETL